MTGLHLLRPRESQLSSVDRPLLKHSPLDSILIFVNDSNDLDAFAAAVSLARQHPWLPLAIGGALPSGGENPYEVLCNGIDVAHWSNSGRLARDVEQVRSAVRARPAPSAEGFARHLARRISPVLKAPLRDIIHSEPITRRTASVLRSHGPWGPPRWRALFRMVELFADAGRSTASLKVLAERRQLVPKTVWQWSRHLFGNTWLVLREWQAWEAVTELALRRAGYCSDLA